MEIEITKQEKNAIKQMIDEEIESDKDIIANSSGEKYKLAWAKDIIFLTKLKGKLK
jgi:hypothetical protein